MTRVLAALVAVLLAAAAFLWWSLNGAREELGAARVEVASLTNSLELARDQAEAADKATAQAAAAQARIHTQIKEVLREVPVRIPADSCPLPPGWRVLHDAATGQAAEAASGPAAAPVAAQDAAVTVIDNYAACREQDAAYQQLQQWAREVSE